MEKHQNEDSKPITLEDLLRTKRAEQPDRDHWERFDQQLHERMLQTLARRESWYQVVLREARQRWIQTASLGFACLATLMVISPGFAPRASMSEGSGAAQTAEQQSSSATVAYSANQITETINSFVNSAFVPDYDFQDYAVHAVSAAPADPSHFTREFAASTIHRSSSGSEAIEMEYRSGTVNSDAVRSDRLLF